MSLSFTLPIILLFAQVAPGFEPGEEVVTLHPVEMKSITGSPVALAPAPG